MGFSEYLSTQAKPQGTNSSAAVKGLFMYSVSGGCHCGNISYVAEFTKEPSTYKPHLCDCKLCTSHAAAYASDRKGTLEIIIKDNSGVTLYRQGSRIADFLICKNCGVMTHVIYEEDGIVYSSINVRSAQNFDRFGDCQTAHLEDLHDKSRIKLWKAYWFPNVKVAQ